MVRPTAFSRSEHQPTREAARSGRRGARRSSWLAWLVLATLLFSLAADAAPKRRKGKRKRATRPAPQGPVEVPIEVRAGPIALLPSPPAFGDQPVHAGLRLHVAAVVDQALIKRYRKQLPAWARQASTSVSEVQIRPWYLLLIPDTLVISPQLKDTGMYGAFWHPIGIGLPFINTEGFKLKAEADLSIGALLVHSQSLGGGSVANQSITFTVRPGVNLGLTGIIPLGEHWLISAGWASEIFVPQVLGGGFFDALPIEESLWHLGGPFVMLHYRFPMKL